MRISYLKRAVVTLVAAAYLLIGCEAVAPNSTRFEGLNHALKRWSGKNEKKEDMPPLEKRLASAQYTRDNNGKIVFVDPEAARESNLRRLVPYKGE